MRSIGLLDRLSSKQTSNQANMVHAWTRAIGHACTMSIVHACHKATMQTCTMAKGRTCTVVHACTLSMVQACIMALEHLCTGHAICIPMPTVRACSIAKAHACNTCMSYIMYYAHVSCSSPKVLMFFRR